jgi:hypothetical protein
MQREIKRALGLLESAQHSLEMAMLAVDGRRRRLYLDEARARVLDADERIAAAAARAEQEKSNG